MSMSRKIPAPVKNPETAHFWQAAQEGNLLYRQCLQCEQPHFYPRSICPFCGSDHTEWKTASGLGTIYSYSVMRRVPAPYAIAYITLDEEIGRASCRERVL